MIIALTGHKQCGKSYCAKILEEKGFKRINFKDELLKEIKEYFPDLLNYWAEKYEMTVDKLLEKKPCKEVRFLMQNYGTELRRSEDSKYWTDRWHNKAIEEDNVVCDDCRFLNEADNINMLNGQIIRVLRPGYDGDSHKSETEQDKIKVDFTINANDVEELEIKFNLILNQCLK